MVEIVGLPGDLAARPEVVFGPAMHWSIGQGRRLWGPGPAAVTRFAAVVDGNVVAAAAALLSQVHPARHWAFVEVRESERRRGVGEAMVQELRRRLPHGAPLRCKAQVGSAGERLARRAGLEQLMGTRMIRVERQGGLEPSEEVVAEPALSVSDVVVDAWRCYYIGGHFWDPVGQMSLAYWRETLGEDTTILRWPSAGAVRGIAIVGPDGDWTGGAVDRSDSERDRIASVLLAAAFVDHEVLDIEYDDWMSEVTAMLTAVRHEETDRSVILADPA